MIEQRITLRYGAQQIPAIVQAVQGDTGRDVIFELADYEIPAGATANYYIDKPDDTAVYNSAEVISSTEIRAHLTEQALAAPGRNNGQVRILSDDEVITSFDFVLEVAAFRGILHMQSETEINIFDQAIEDAVNTATEEAVAEIQAQTPVVTGMQISIAPTYSASNTYAVGDYVMYNAQLYRCKTEITTAEAWTAAHWEQVPLANDVNDLKRAFNANFNYDVEYITDYGYIDTSGEIGSTVSLTPIDNSSFCYTVVNVNAGDRLMFKGTGGGAPRLWAFLDKDNTLLSHSGAGTSETNAIKTAEVDGKFVFNSYITVSDAYLKKAYSMRTEDEKTQDFIDAQNEQLPLNYITNIERDTVLRTGVQNIGEAVNMRLGYKTLGFGTIVIPCKSSDYFVLHIAQPTGYTQFRLWAFVDAQYKVINRADGALHDVMPLGLTLKAPTDSAYLICNVSNDTTGMGIVKYSQNPETNKAVTYSQLIDNPYQTVDYTDRIRVGWNLYLGVNAGTVIDEAYGGGSSRFSTAEIECSEGDVFELKSITGDTYPMWAWVDVDRKLISRATGNWYDNDSSQYPIRLTAPTNSAKFLCVFDLALCPDAYVAKIGERVNTPTNLVKYDATDMRYLFPTYSGTPDVVEIPFSQSKIFYNFTQFYSLFHDLVTANVLEEINMSTEYLVHNTDSIPSDISSITNGGMYMYHLIAPQNDGSDWGIKHKPIKMVLVSGLHGSETNSIWNMYHLLKNIVDGTFKRQYNLIGQFVDLYVIPLACPDGIQNHTRAKSNGINLNRDFNVYHWGKVEDSANEPNSQYETRCISWWLEQIEPDCLIDHHTSAGDNVTEGANLLSWGDSDIMAIASTIDEAILDGMPVAKNYAPVLEPYHQMFGHAQCLSTYSLGYGMLEKHACQNGIIGATYEVVEGLTWYGQQIFGYTDEDETKIMSLDHFNFMNFLLKFLGVVRDMKNGSIGW